jgi:hypothetical protein
MLGMPPAGAPGLRLPRPMRQLRYRHSRFDITALGFLTPAAFLQALETCGFLYRAYENAGADIFTGKISNFF